MSATKSKKNKVMEVFYDEHGREIKLGDADYDGYLSGDKYYGSYFIDEMGQVVRTNNPNRAITPPKNQSSPSGKSSSVIIICAILAFIALLIFILSLTTMSDNNKALYEVDYSVTDAVCSKDICSATLDKVDIELKIGGQITPKIEQVDVNVKKSTLAASGISCKEFNTTKKSKTRKYKCTGIALQPGSNIVDVEIKTETKASNSSALNVKHIDIKRVISIGQNGNIEAYEYDSARVGAYSDVKTIYLKNFSPNDANFKQRVVATLRKDGSISESDNMMVYVYSDEGCFQEKTKHSMYVCEDADSFVALYEIGGKDENLHGLEFFPDVAEGDILYQYKEHLKGSL